MLPNLLLKKCLGALVKRKVLILIGIVLLSFSSFRASAHAVQVGYTVLPNGFLRVYIEHWHGAQTTSSLVGNGMSITTTYGNTTITQNVNPTGAFNGYAWNNLPGAGSNIQILATSSGANAYNNWAYYDFAPAACGVPVSIVLNGGLTAVLVESEPQIWPQTIAATFNDNAPPTITPSNTSTTVACGALGANVNFSATALDNCTPNPTVTFSIPPGSFFPVGTTSVTAYSSDANNNSGQLTFNVTVSVIDNVNPVIINCPSSQSVSTDQGLCSAIVSYALPTFSDNCGVASIQQISGLPSGAAFPKGVTNNIFRITDGSNNFVDCSFTVTVVDNQPPTALCKNATVVINAQGNGSITTANINNGSFDNCGPVTVSISSGRTSFTCADAGQTFAVVLLVTDSRGLTSTCTAQVSVTDPNSVCNRAPVAVCKAINLSAGANCDATALAAAFDGGSTDADGDVLTFSVSPAGPYAKGTTNVTFTVTDSKGASSSCTTTVTVNDNTPPTINCQANIVVNNNPNACGAIVTFAKPIATDNCTGGAFNFFNGGEPNNAGGEDYLQLYTNGTWNDLPNIGGLRYIIEINSINTTPIVGYNLIGTFGGHTYFISTGTNNWTGARAAALSVGADLASINTFAEDQFLAPYGGSTWVGGFQDHSDPGYVEPGNSSQNFGGWKWVDGTQLGAGQIVVTQTAGLPSGSLFPIGNTQITWRATDERGNWTDCSFTITVFDIQYPVLVGVPANATVSCDAVPAFPNVTGTDNCSVSTPVTLTQTIIPGNCPGNYQINRTWSTTDPSGLTANKVQVITVIDNKAPVFSAIPVAAITAECDAIPAAPILTASDNCDQAPSLTYTEVRTNGSSPNDYILTRTWVTNDACGNGASVSQIVTVKDTKVPTLSTPSNIAVTNDAGVCGASVTFLAMATDNCSSVAITYSSASGSVFPVGTTVVTVTAKDLSGNTTIGSFNIKVTDNEKPTISAPANVSVNNDAGICGAVVALGTPVTGDNCAVANTTNNAPSVFQVGTTTVIWTVTDLYGNTQTATQTVTVFDNEKPTITAPASISVNNDAGICGAVVALGTPVTGDNCGVASFINNALAVYPVGTTTVTWTVTDIYGNSQTATQSVTVSDNEKPITKCKPVTVTLVNGAASITAADINDNSTDNCGIATIVISNGSFNCNNIGANSVTLTITDIHGNVSSCNAVVTVVGEIPSCTIASIPTTNTYTGGVSTNLYLGYGAQSTTLKVTPAANGAPYTYAWSGSAVNMLSSTTSGAPVFTPTAAGTYTFTVVTTNVYGCTTSCSISICVTDIRVVGNNGNGSGKVYLCHLPPGNPANRQTLSISVNAVNTHLTGHAGDRLGSCEITPCAPAVATSSAPIITSFAKEAETSIKSSEEELKITVMPNPSTTYFTLKLESKYQTLVEMRVMDASGRIVDARSKLGSNSTLQIGHNYSSGTYYAELIQGSKRKVVQLIKGKG